MSQSATDRSDRLHQIGIDIIGDEDDPLVRAECVRIARRVHLSGNKVIGFMPTGDDIAVPPVLIQLGVAFTELTGAAVAVVDANVRWPGLAGLATDDNDDADADDAPDGDAGSLYQTTWVRESLALLSPRHSERAGEAVPQLARILLGGSEHFAHVLVDLTGFDLLGEHASAAACMDAVILLARARRSRERHLLMYEKAVPRSRFLGVLLVG